ncbi:hypothetical protein BST20_27110 [Mycobacterium branderi]|uniref:Uncharacterized protein n=1 Tax=Mycobacterium branderi TaxID=43348 RepID=A0AA91RFI1_9MYCO|nr:hypothetical protein BST20_27110 [Mycobacterium branderi]
MRAAHRHRCRSWSAYIRCYTDIHLMRHAEFAAEAHRQSALAAASPYEQDDQAFIDAISSFGHDADPGLV